MEDKIDRIIELLEQLVDQKIEPIDDKSIKDIVDKFATKDELIKRNK